MSKPDHKDGDNVVWQSFTTFEEDDSASAIDMLAEHEQIVIDQATGDDYDYVYHSVVNTDPADYYSNLAAAGAESLYFHNRYPELAAITNVFPSLYRVARAFEQIGVLTRGGQTLFVGSGTTIGEVAAMYTVPPTKSDTLEQLHNPPQDLARRFRDIYEHYVKNELKTITPPLLPGKAFAIEPNSDLRTIAAIEASVIDVSSLKIGIYDGTLGQFRQIGRSRILDNIVWHRAEPRIAPDPHDEVDFLVSLLKPNGSILITVGSGNNHAETKARFVFFR